MVLTESPTMKRYKETMIRCIQMYYEDLDPVEINNVLDYSIQKRYQKASATVVNSYTNRSKDTTLLAVSDYIISREPIVTAFGTMFKKHEVAPNPLVMVLQSFLDKRSKDKKMMFKYPKGSEMFEKYNLLQQLDKIDANGLYGTIGMATSLIYNINCATSITSQGRALVSAASMQFEMFLANNVKFGSLNEVVEFIEHICSEYPTRRFRDVDVLDLCNQNIRAVDCFAKVVLSCGYRWIPNDKELDIIWKIINNLSQENINRVYYKNNLYEFMSNSKPFAMVRDMLKKLKKPLFNSLNIPEEIADEIKAFGDLLMEYVYYGYMIIDRIDRCDNMIKSVIMVSDTDSTIISLDAWYRFVVNQISGDTFKIANYCGHPISFFEREEGKPLEDYIGYKVKDPEPKVLDYNFLTDEITEVERTNNPDVLTPNDNVRFSIINILAYVLDRVINDYMERFCLNNHSLYYKENGTFNRKCKILMKNEFTFLRLLMTQVKKNYASLIAVQEGKIVPEEEQLDIKGIECFVKSSKPKSTRDALQKILLEDIMKTPVIDQLRIVKSIAILQKQIIDSVHNGSKEYYKPVTIKSVNRYEDPMRIQGIKASVAWNAIKPEELPAINLNERNAISIAKVVINKATIYKIESSYPEIYQNMQSALSMPEFKDGIDAVAIPIDVYVPEWLVEFINYNEIISDNISGFPYESVGIMRMGKENMSYTNIVQL